ncbi:SGNH/GDSL hydrolase family protein [Streptomyces sp. NPDC002886]|uniref:SGNH/GDSL hydrolase family protein n=1 Tax=Streptomyces sp. NPDC002886 TaxID=3364667 RepID=UPI00367730A8
MNNTKPYTASSPASEEATAFRRSLGRAAILSAAALATTLTLTSCGNAPQDSDAQTPAVQGGQVFSTGSQGKKPQKVLWMGDSVAVGEALPLEASLKASGIGFASMASEGGGGVLGPKPITDATWQELAKKLSSEHPDTVAYQITTYDWGTAAEQQAAYEKLITTAKAAGARALIVSSPPFDVDSDFYAKSKAAIASAPKAAKAAVAAHFDDASFLDSVALWGTDYKAPKAQRASDKIHSCQQGTASFAQWFISELGELDGFKPADAKKWAAGEWTKSDVFSKLNCA